MAVSVNGSTLSRRGPSHVSAGHVAQGAVVV